MFEQIKGRCRRRWGKKEKMEEGEDKKEKEEEEEEKQSRSTWPEETASYKEMEKMVVWR